MLDNDPEPRCPFAVGDAVQLAAPQVDDVVASVKYVFSDGNQVLLSLPLGGQTIWDVTALVPASRRPGLTSRPLSP
ncbi:MAG: hypothetical protein WCF84_03395 [Anaerolineae bacterium]